MKARTPIAGCKMVPRADARQAGQWQWVPLADGEVEDLRCVDRRAGAGAMPSFADLRARDFPAAELTPARTSARDIWPGPEHAAMGIPALYFQATFVHGGCVLNSMFFHASLDATYCCVVLRVWAEELRRLQGLIVDDALDLAPLVAARDALLRPETRDLPPDGPTPGPDDYREYLVLPETPTAPPPKMRSENNMTQAHIFTFPPAALAQLKRDAAPVAANLQLLRGDDQQDLPSYISTLDALNALVFKAIMAAQFPDPGAVEDPERPAYLSIALDERRRAGLPRFTVGNLLAWAPVWVALRDIVAEATLADLAVLIRRALAPRSDAAFVQRHEAFFRRLPDLGPVIMSALLDLPGRNILSSSWRDIPYYDIEWGPLLGHRAKVMRSPSVGMCPGFQIILPERPDKEAGTIEMIVNVENEAIGRLLEHPLWARYAQKPHGL